MVLPGHADPTDQRSDLYSLGCIFHEMLTGHRPFAGTSAMGVIYKHAHAPRPRLPAGLESLQPTLDALLAIDPAKRFSSAAELLDAVGEARGAGKRGQSPFSPSPQPLARPGEKGL